MAIAVAAFGSALACNAILGLGDYKVGAAAGDGGPITGDESPAACNAALEAGACYPCTPITNDQLENACTDSLCVPFDDSTRIPNFNGTLPDIPEPIPDGG
ncbi:MAG: hypothetical protein ABI461_00675 [Polyangiaceae bacterium]